MNQFIMLSVFFHSFIFSFLDKVVFIFCNKCLLILPISLFVVFNNLLVGRFYFFLLPFNMMKLLPAPLISMLSMMFASLACLFPSLLIFASVYLSGFLCFDAIAFCKRSEYSSLLGQYTFDVFSAAV